MGISVLVHLAVVRHSPVALRYRLQSNPLVGKLTTKYFLPLGTRQVGDHVVFFNFGYEEDPPMALPLSESDEPNRYCIQLYRRRPVRWTSPARRC